MKRLFPFFSMALLFYATSSQGQLAAPPPAPLAPLRSAAELDQLLGPIALYPDPLIGEILPASTLPTEIVLADRYVSGGGDPNLIDAQQWDPSIKALARYPTVLKWMDDNLGWTTALGQAFLYQQADVMDSIQRLRARALALGNLQSNSEQTVVNYNGTIEVLPANPQVIYVPVYQPDYVYYEEPFSGSFVTFGLGYAVGGWLDHDFDWHDHHIFVWGRDHPRPADWWHRRPGDRELFDRDHASVWHPRGHVVPAGRDLDRGWDSHPSHRTVTAVGSPSGSIERHEGRPQPSRGAAIQHSMEASRARAANGALIGVQSSHETRQFSTRGQESRHGGFSPAAPSHSEPPLMSPGNPGGRPRH